MFTNPEVSMSKLPECKSCATPNYPFYLTFIAAVGMIGSKLMFYCLSDDAAVCNE